MDSKRNLAQKLLDIMSEAGTMEKAGYNAHNKYAYVKESDVSEKFQGLLAKHGVFILSSVLSCESKQVQSSTGKPNILSSVVMEYTLINVDDPKETYTVRASGDGMDVGDKAIYKALTGAHKYFFIRNFNLGSDDDAEKDSPAVSKAEPVKGGIL